MLVAGVACTNLIADPKAWIRRRVETVEMITYEETRRRVSIDFVLSNDLLSDLTISDGVVVPISVLTKEARKKFDLRDESGRSIPVLGREQNGDLSHIALMNAALDALPEDTPSEVFEILAADLRQVVFGSPDEATDALGFFFGSAEAGDRWRAAIVEDETCQKMLDILWENYVLFAVLAPGGPHRRVLKYSYADDFDLSPFEQRWWERFQPWRLLQRLSRPDRRRFIVDCGGASRAASFHAEVAIPEELQCELGMLYDFENDVPLSALERGVSRLSVYANTNISDEHRPGVYLEVSAQRAGRPLQTAALSLLVCALLWLGVRSGLDSHNPGSAVSMLLAGVALFTALTAVQGEHRIVRAIFAASRFWLVVVTLAALIASATLALEYPRTEPVWVWRWCAIACSVATARLLWSAVRAPS